MRTYFGLIALACFLIAIGTTSNASSISNDSKQNFGKIPIYFVENRGQLDEKVAYYVPGKDQTLYFTNEGITFSFNSPTPSKIVPASLSEKDESRWITKLNFKGANTKVRPVGFDLTPAIFSYFRGSKEDWKTGLKTYASLKYSNLWPGIDLIYTGSIDQVKYHFVVKPGANPADIQLTYSGATNIQINNEGALEIQTPGNRFQDPSPVAFQLINGHQKNVQATYALEQRQADGSFTYHFNLGEYNPHESLIIDPAHLIFAGYIGGTEWDIGTGIFVNSQQYIYVAGTTASTEASLPVSVGPDLTYNGAQFDGFVEKLTLDGSTLLYVGYIGGCGNDYILEVAADSKGAAYVTGSTDSPECFPLLVGPDLTWNGGGADSFVTKIERLGRNLEYSGFIGGAQNDNAIAIALDQKNYAYIAGITNSDHTSFPTIFGPMLTYNGGDTDAFVVKVMPNGSGFVYSGFIGGIGADRVGDIAVDSAYNAYILGDTDSTQTSFPMKIGPDMTFNGVLDVFVTKISSSAAILYSGYIGGSSVDGASGVDGGGIAVDQNGYAYITGSTMSNELTFPVLNGPDLTYNSGFGFDAFVAKIEFDGSRLLYCGYIGGFVDDRGAAIGVDTSGRAHVVGSTNSDETDFPVISGPDLTYNSGGNDAYIARVKSDGSSLDYCGYIGGDSVDNGVDVSILKSHAFVLGNTSSDQTTFPVFGGPILAYSGNQDAFVARVSP